MHIIEIFVGLFNIKKGEAKLRKKLTERVCHHGAYLMGRLEVIAKSYKKTISVKKLGPMIFDVDFDSAENRDKVIRYYGKNYLLLVSIGERTIRMVALSAITIPQIDLAMNKFYLALEKTFQ